MRRKTKVDDSSPTRSIVIGGTSTREVHELLSAISVFPNAQELQKWEMGDSVLACLGFSDKKNDSSKSIRLKGWLAPSGYADLQKIPYLETYGSWFIMDVRIPMLEQSRKALSDFIQLGLQAGLPILKQPFLLQYHRVNEHEGFDAGRCDQWLGVPPNTVIRAQSNTGGIGQITEPFHQLIQEVEKIG